MKGIFKGLATLIVALTLTFLVGCNYAHSNVQTLITEDCGVTWQLIKAGQTIPRGTGNYCFRSVTLPDRPMDGSGGMRATFKDNVKATSTFSYSYQIVDGVKFMSSAKYIGNQADTEDSKANDTRFDGAENTVIDKHIVDIASELLKAEDIVDFDSQAFENRLREPLNTRLAERGVRIDFLVFTPDPDDLTADSIDAATALRIYRANQIPDEVAFRFIEAKNGAAKFGNTNPSAVTVEKPKD